jgi:hypothetical protein
VLARCFEERDGCRQVRLDDPACVGLPRVRAVRGQMEEPVRTEVAREPRDRVAVAQVELVER